MKIIPNFNIKINRSWNENRIKNYSIHLFIIENKVKTSGENLKRKNKYKKKLCIIGWKERKAWEIPIGKDYPK